MKIGIVCYPTYGGSGVVATEIGLGLARMGHEVHFITYKRPARLSSFSANVYLHEVSSFDYPLKSFFPVAEFSINASDGVTTVSNQLKQQTEETFNVTTDIKVIYNFIDFSRFRKTDKDHFKMAIAPDGEKIMVHVSNFRKVKRVEDVIHVFERVYKKMPCKLMLIGDGPERQNMEELCRQIGLCSEIRFLGKQDAVEELLAVADLFVLPSANESFGLAALEAMACEVPVVSTNIGGLPEVNIDGKTGFLCDVGDVDTMAARALEILSDEETHQKFRTAAFEHAKTFDIANILPTYESFYQEVIDKVKSRTSSVA